MVNVFDVANCYIDECNSRIDEQITNLRLNKLLYYAQGYHLARTGKPLFEDSIKAFEDGPVVPSVYRRYKICGKHPIMAADEYRTEYFTDDEIETIAEVWHEFGKYTGCALFGMIRKEGTPWSDACVDGTYGAEIPRESVKKYFAEHPIPTLDELVSQIPVVDKLPADWYDPEEDAIWGMHP